jgi:hydrogenase maturation protease HycI
MRRSDYDQGGVEPPQSKVLRTRGHAVEASTLILAKAGYMDLREQLATVIQGHVVVMGIGNPCRGDDAAGSLLAQLISDAPGVRVIDAQEVPESYMRQVVGEGPDTVVLIDSVDLDSAPGSVAFLEKHQVAGYWPSTHRMPLSLLMHYLERETHARIFLIAIQPRHTAFMQPMSGEVHASVASIADVLKGVLEMRCMPAK